MFTLLLKGVKNVKMKIFPFVTGVYDTNGAPWAANISANFWKIWNGFIGILNGSGETESQKNLRTKILWHCPFKLEQE